MNKILLTFFLPIAIIAQKFQMNDPYAGSAVTIEVNIHIDKYYPVFGNSEKPFTNDRIIHLTDIDGAVIIYLHFEKNYSAPKYDVKAKALHLYYPEYFYDYIMLRLEKDTAFVVYKEYKDGHKWGEIYFDKYP